MKKKELKYDFKEILISNNSSKLSKNAFSFKNSPELIKNKEYKNNDLSIYNLKIFELQDKELTNKELIEYLAFNPGQEATTKRSTCLEKLKILNKDFIYKQNKTILKPTILTKKVKNHSIKIDKTKNCKTIDKNLTKFYEKKLNFKDGNKNNKLRSMLIKYSYHNKAFLNRIKNIFNK